MCSVRWFSPRKHYFTFVSSSSTHRDSHSAGVCRRLSTVQTNLRTVTHRAQHTANFFILTYICRVRSVCMCVLCGFFWGCFPPPFSNVYLRICRRCHFCLFHLYMQRATTTKKKPKRNNKYCTNILHEETFAQDSRRWLLLLYMFVLHFGSRCLLFLLNIAAAHHSLCHCVCVCLSHWEHRMQSAASVIACIPPKRIHQKQRQATPQDHSLDISCKKTNRTTTKMKTGKKNIAEKQ